MKQRNRENLDVLLKSTSNPDPEFGETSLWIITKQIRGLSCPLQWGIDLSEDTALTLRDLLGEKRD